MEKNKCPIVRMGDTFARALASPVATAQADSGGVRKTDVTVARRDAAEGLMQSGAAEELVAQAREKTREAQSKKSFIDRITHSSSHILVRSAAIASLIVTPTVVAGVVILLATSSTLDAETGMIVVAALATVAVMSNSSQ
jgi:hypothetical protein